MQMREVPGVPNAETHIALLAQHGNQARYALRPVTGQKHQLRAHMNALGIPIVNDRLYPQLLAHDHIDCTDQFERPLQLLAKEIAFIDPLSGQARRFTSHRRLADWGTDIRGGN